MKSWGMARIRGKISALGLLLLLFGCGGYLLWDTFIALYRAYASRSWPTTPARIEGLRHCCLESQKTAVWYTYYVDGTLYSGAAIDLPHLSADQVEEAVELHKSVPVHYDPQRPEISVLDPGFMRARAIWLLGGFLYLWLGVVGVRNNSARAHTLPRARLRHAA